MDVGMTTTCWSSAESQGGEDLGDFEYDMVGSARQAGLSTSGAADLLGFLMHRVQSKQEKINREQQFSGQRCLVDATGQRKMARLIWSDRKARQ